MRVRGGTAGLLAAIEHGICDELDAKDPVDIPFRHALRGADERRAVKREARRRRKHAKRLAARVNPC